MRNDAGPLTHDFSLYFLVTAKPSSEAHHTRSVNHMTSKPCPNIFHTALTLCEHALKNMKRHLHHERLPLVKLRIDATIHLRGPSGEAFWQGTARRSSVVGFSSSTGHRPCHSATRQNPCDYLC